VPVQKQSLTLSRYPPCNLVMCWLAKLVLSATIHLLSQVRANNCDAKHNPADTGREAPRGPSRSHVSPPAGAARDEKLGHARRPGPRLPRSSVHPEEPGHLAGNQPVRSRSR
jgi:hypothetical protein